MSEAMVISAAIAKLQLKKGDVLVLKSSDRLSKAAGESMTRYAKERLPEGIHVLVIDSTTTLGVLSRGSHSNAGAKARKG